MADLLQVWNVSDNSTIGGNNDGRTLHSIALSDIDQREKTSRLNLVLHREYVSL